MGRARRKTKQKRRALADARLAFWYSRIDQSAEAKHRRSVFWTVVFVAVLIIVIVIREWSSWDIEVDDSGEWYF